MAELRRSERRDAAPGGALVLASASPRRRELLAVLAPDFEVRPADLDESVGPGETPTGYVQRMAVEKAAAIAAARPDAFVLGADTTVVVDQECLGKPRDADDARGMLAALSGRWHEVYSAVALARPGCAPEPALSVTRVAFDRLSTGWIDRYVESGEPMDKAGAYAIQGRAAQWVRRIEGSYSGVMGLPLFETAELLRWAGLETFGSDV